MPVFDTPITTDDQSLKKVLGQKQPAIVILHSSNQKDKPLDDALNRAARQHAGDLLVIQVDITENPETHAKYGSPTTPALVTLTQAFFGRKEKSRAESIRPADVRAHIDHLLKDIPLPEPKQSSPHASQSAGHPVTVNDQNFRKEVLKSKEPVLVDFWAAWCAPCRSVAPHIEKMASEYQGRLKVAKLDVDSNPVIAQRYQIRSIPTFIVFEGGQPIGRLSGANPSAIRSLVEQVTRGT